MDYSDCIDGRGLICPVKAAEKHRNEARRHALRLPSVEEMRVWLGLSRSDTSMDGFIDRSLREYEIDVMRLCGVEEAKRILDQKIIAMMRR